MDYSPTLRFRPAIAKGRYSQSAVCHYIIIYVKFVNPNPTLTLSLTLTPNANPTLHSAPVS